MYNQLNTITCVKCRIKFIYILHKIMFMYFKNVNLIKRVAPSVQVLNQFENRSVLLLSSNNGLKKT